MQQCCLFCIAEEQQKIVREAHLGDGHDSIHISGVTLMRLHHLGGCIIVWNIEPEAYSQQHQLQGKGLKMLPFPRNNNITGYTPEADASASNIPTNHPACLPLHVLET